MSRQRNKLHALEEIANQGMTYRLSFAYDGAAYYHRPADYNDETNTVALVDDEIIAGGEANDMLRDAVDIYILGHKRGAYVSEEFAPLFQYRKDHVKEIASNN